MGGGGRVVCVCLWFFAVVVGWLYGVFFLSSSFFFCVLFCFVLFCFLFFCLDWLVLLFGCLFCASSRVIDVI